MHVMKISCLASFLWLGINTVLAAPVIPTKDQSIQQIQWGTCSDDSPASLECGQLQVPLDWSAQNGELITLGIMRVRASDPSTRIGSLFFNPGGPGGAATDICIYQASTGLFSEALMEKFDLICPDPRGVGLSTPVTCDPDTWNQNVSVFPKTEAELEELIKVNTAIGERCLNMTGPLLGHVDTVSAAKDIEAIRLALNDGKLNWLGASYGSQLGYVYAQLFPENIRAMALDGILDHTTSPRITQSVEDATYEDSLNRFFQWCASNTTACGFEGTNLPKMFDNLVASANLTPVPAPGCVATADTALAGTCRPTVTGDDIILNVPNFLIQANHSTETSSWVGLGTALNQSIIGNNATLFSSPIATTNTSMDFSSTAISCLDWATYDISNTTQALLELTQIQASAWATNPHVGPASQSWVIQMQCLGWPVAVVDPQELLDQHALSKAPPILLVNSIHDPSTSYVWAQNIHKQIPNSVLLTRDGDGHTSVLLNGDASAYISAYLVNGTLPADGTVVTS